MFLDANDFQENVCFSGVYLHSGKCFEKYFTVFGATKNEKMFLFFIFNFFIKNLK